MAHAKKYNLQGTLLGDIETPALFEAAETDPQLIKDYIVAVRENLRQWSASTKTKSELVHTTKKPYAQKGTGRARQGSFVSAQFRGGGIIFGPKPKFDQHVKVNRKAKRAVIRSLVGEKIKSANLLILDSTKMEAPRTKTIVEFLNTCGINGRVLFILEEKTEEKPSEKHKSFIKSLRNLPNADLSMACNVNGYDVMNAGTLVITESALAEMQQWLA